MRIHLPLRLLLFFFSIVGADALHPLNKIWMTLGILMSVIINPIVLCAIFFGLFLPTAMLMRLCGRDELISKFPRNTRHWILRNESLNSGTFKIQF